MTDYEKRWEVISKQIDREYKIAWVKLVIYILIIAALIGLSCWIWNSNLPTWLKVWLIG